MTGTSRLDRIGSRFTAIVIGAMQPLLTSEQSATEVVEATLRRRGTVPAPPLGNDTRIKSPVS